MTDDARRRFPIALEIQHHAGGVDDAWLREHPSYAVCDAALVASIVFGAGASTNVAFSGIDGRSKEHLAAATVLEVWRALARHLADRGDLDDAARALCRHAADDVDAWRRDRAASLPPALPIGDDERSRVIARAKPLLAQAMARAAALKRPVSDYCVVIGVEPAAGEPDGAVSTVEQARTLVPPGDPHGVAARLDEPRSAHDVLLLVKKGDELFVVSAAVDESDDPTLH